MVLEHLTYIHELIYLRTAVTETKQVTIDISQTKCKYFLRLYLMAKEYKQISSNSEVSWPK